MEQWKQTTTTSTVRVPCCCEGGTHGSHSYVYNKMMMMKTNYGVPQLLVQQEDDDENEPWRSKRNRIENWNTTLPDSNTAAVCIDLTKTTLSPVGRRPPPP